MTTFTSEDRINATKIVEEAPYHPGYEDAVIGDDNHTNPLIQELNEYRRMNAKYDRLSKTIIQFLKDGQKWKR
jgi:hypothetical protein